MTVTDTDIQAVAKLARLHVEKNEAEEFAAHFEGILGYFNALSTAEEEGRLLLKDVEPLVFTDGDIPPLREDAVLSSPAGKAVLAAAANARDGFFVVPRILEEF
ncbi:MAG: Asp-tRNA(Asn)/Glu-tRNA(Gln) amidotransferase subunit GatC [Synergistaceae bacterium]|nr:Asp-tRNA(Asn)/Glu-tRNA(Gln) amidotransferase subunit GatC [Synergistaceae bacterium]